MGKVASPCKVYFSKKQLPENIARSRDFILRGSCFCEMYILALFIVFYT